MLNLNRPRTSRIPPLMLLAGFTVAGISPPPPVRASGSPDRAPDGDKIVLVDASAAGEPLENLTLGEVVVSARRRTERAQDVPIPIATVDGSSLEAAGQVRLEDLNSRLASTNILFANPRQTSIAVRGLGNNPANDALESSVGVYLDDVYLGRASMANADLLDVQQVALLRGPQGTLFGKNTTAGVVNITTRLPTFTPEAWAEASFGDLGFNQIRGSWSGPIVDDQLAARISAGRSYQRGFVNDVTDGRQLNGINRDGARGQLLWKPSERFDLRIIGDYERENSDTGATVPYSLGPNNGAKYLAALAAAGAKVLYDPSYETTTIDAAQHMYVQQGGLSAAANWKLGDYRLTSITAWRTWQFQPLNDGDGTNVDALTAAGQIVDDRQFSEELRLASPDSGTLNYVVGAYFFRQLQDNRAYTYYGHNGAAILALGLGAPSFVGAQSVSYQYLQTLSYAGFGQVSWKPVEGWEFTAGIRDTDETKDVNVNRTAGGTTNPAFILNPSFAAASTGPLELHNNNVSGLLSASYKFTPTVLGYVSAARGAKAGGINPAIPLAGLTNSSLFVAPEVATDFEAGFKSELFEHRLVLNANLYWVRVNDYQATLLEQPSSGTTLQQVLTNIGKVQSRGVELEAEASPVAGLSLRLAASYDDATYLSYADAPCPAEALAPLNLSPKAKTCDLTGQRLVGAPKWLVDPGVSYEHALGSQLTGTAALDYAWRSTFFGSADDSLYARIPSYGLLNVRYSVAGSLGGGKRWSASLWSNNVFDKRYAIGGLTLSGALYNYGLTPGLPRTVGASFRVDL